MDRIYLDNSATTRIDSDVLEKMLPYFSDIYGNASSLHSFGRDGAKAVLEARERVAKAIGAKTNEIYFTSGGTEADNWAIRGITEFYKDKHIIISSIEHPAIRQTALAFQKNGGKVSQVPVDKEGIIIFSELEKLITKDTVLISVMLANNEIGTIQPVDEIAKLVKSKNIFLHTDAVQAVGSIPVNVNELGVDMLSLSAHKFYGPKGVGVLYLRNGIKLGKIMTGGHQERTMRGGTTNVPAIVGLGIAIENAALNLEKNTAYIKALRDKFVVRVEKEIPDCIYNGHREKRLPQNANFSFKYLEGESILFRLDLAGVATSSGSACSSGSLEPSHVLLSIGLPHETAHGSIRFSFGKYNTEEEVDIVVLKLKKIIADLRELSPLI